METLQQTTPPARELLTLGALRFDSFGGNKTELLPSAQLSFDDFANTKQVYEAGAPIPYSGLQVLQMIRDAVHEQAAALTGKNFSQVHVYRNHYQVPGYVKTRSKYDPAEIKEISPSTPISDVSFKRFIALLELTGNDEFSEAIAIKCDGNKQVEIAVGPHVRVCSNFNIFSRDNFITNLRENMGIDWMIEKIKRVIHGIERRFQMDMETIQRLKLAELTERNVSEMIGDMVMRYETATQIVPLTQAHDIARKIRMAIHNHEARPVTSMWDFMNKCTEVVRLSGNSGDTTLQNIRTVSSYCLQEAGIEPLVYDEVEVVS